MSGALLAEHRRLIAGAHPKDVLRMPFFWRRQTAFLSAIVLGLIAFRLLAPYTYSAARGWDAMVLAVQSLACWGIAIAAKGLAVLEVETSIVREIEMRGVEYLRDIKSGQRPRADLDKLEQIIVPVNTSTPPPAMIRLFQHICKEAKDRKFESSVSIMQPYREEQLEDIFKLQNLQKVALWLGILGTFIGLLVAMQSADLNRLLDNNQLIDVVRKMFGGLVISFSASLAGLEVAVVLGVMLLILRRRQEEYFKAMESAVVTMLSLARNAINKDEFLAELGQVSNVVTQLSDRVYSETQEIAIVQQAIRDQSEEIRAGMNKLSQAGAGFEAFLQQLSAAQTAFIGDIRNLYDTISLKNLAATAQESVAHAGQLMSDKITIATTLVANRLGDFNAAVERMGSVMAAQSRESAESAKKLTAQINSATTENVTAIKGVARQMQEILGRDTSATSSVRNEMQELARRVGELSRAVDRLEYVAPPRRSVWQFITSLRW